MSKLSNAPNSVFFQIVGFSSVIMDILITLLKIT